MLTRPPRYTKSNLLALSTEPFLTTYYLLLDYSPTLQMCLTISMSAC